MQTKSVIRKPENVGLGRHRSSPDNGSTTLWQAIVMRWRRLADHRGWRRHRSRTTPEIPPRTMTMIEAAGMGGNDAPIAWRKGISR